MNTNLSKHGFPAHRFQAQAPSKPPQGATKPHKAIQILSCFLFKRCQCLRSTRWGSAPETGLPKPSPKRASQRLQTKATLKQALMTTNSSKQGFPAQRLQAKAPSKPPQATAKPHKAIQILNCFLFKRCQCLRSTRWGSAPETGFPKPSPKKASQRLQTKATLKQALMNTNLSKHGFPAQRLQAQAKSKPPQAITKPHKAIQILSCFLFKRCQCLGHSTMYDIKFSFHAWCTNTHSCHDFLKTCFHNDYDGATAPCIFIMHVETIMSCLFDTFDGATAPCMI